MFVISGEDLKRARNDAGLSRTQMAEKLKLSKTTIQNYEYGVSEVSIGNYLRWMLVCQLNSVAFISAALKRKDISEEIDLEECRISGGNKKDREQISK